jgi:hypothetical protein
MKYKVELTIDVPCSDILDVRLWAEYKTGYTGGLSLNNPLSDCELEATSVRIERA